MKYNKGFLSILLGLLLIVAALFLTAYNLFDELRAKQSVRQVIQQLEEFLPAETVVEEPPVAKDESVSFEEIETAVEEIEIPDYVLNPEMKMPVESINGIDYIGILRIPTLELELPVISEWSYPSLKTAPCRYSGSAYTDDLIIAAHNYTSHFGNLKNLWEGDTITFTDMDGNVFTYLMVEREMLHPTATDEMESGDWDLTLFTCTIGGQSRVTIRCKLEKK